MRTSIASMMLVFMIGWAAALGARPLVIDLTIFDARTSAAGGNITGTSALFRVASDTQLMTIDGAGNATIPTSSVDVTVFGTPIGTIHGVISRPGIQVHLNPSSGTVSIDMPLDIVSTSQGILAQVAALSGYAFQASLGSSPAQSGMTYVYGLPASSRLFWTPDVPGVGALGAGGIPPIPNPAGTLAISILDPAPVPATTPMALLGMALLVLGTGFAFARRHKR